MRSFIFWAAIGVFGCSFALLANDWLAHPRATTNKPTGGDAGPDYVLQPRDGVWSALSALVMHKSITTLDAFRTALETSGVHSEVVQIDGNALETVKLPAVTQLKSEVGDVIVLLLAMRDDRAVLCMMPNGDLRWLPLPQVAASEKQSFLVCTDREPGGLWYPLDGISYGMLNPLDPQLVDLWIPVFAEDVLVESVQADCGCVAVLRYSKTATMGEAVHIQLRLDASAKKFRGGHFSQVLTIRYDDQVKRAVKLRIEGTIKEVARLERPVISLGELRTGELARSRELSFEIYDPDSQILEVSPADLPSGVRWIGNQRRDNTIFLRFDVIPAQLPVSSDGRISAEIRFIATHFINESGDETKQGALIGAIVGTKVPPLQFVPDTVSIGLVKRGSRIDRDVIVVADSKVDPVKLTCVHPDRVTATYENGRIHCEIESPEKIGFFESEVIAKVGPVTKSFRIVGAVDR